MKEAIITYHEKPAAEGDCMVGHWQELIRCKDCKHKDDPFKCILDRDLQEYGSHRTNRYDDWFCADGERKITCEHCAWWDERDGRCCYNAYSGYSDPDGTCPRAERRKDDDGN